MNTPQFVRYEGEFNFASALEEAKKHPEYWQEDILVDVAHHIAQELESRQMTQADLAAKLNVRPAYVSRVLCGHENLTLQTLAKIAFAFDKKWECMLVDQDAHLGLYTLAFDNRTIPVTKRAVTITMPAAASEDDSFATPATVNLEKTYDPIPA